jgi:uncharacterized membrane protein YccC
MQPNATTAAIDSSPRAFAGFPASSWAFAVRVWLATLLALYASFWLELEVPSSAAITVAILAFPTRGQGMEKAGFRFLATVIGVAASIAIAGFFSQTDGLLLAVFGIWVGLCVYAAAMLDGNRAYAAALCCITVALIAIQQIDSPQQVFPTGLARGAALTVGILAVALVNDVLAAPDYHPVLLTRLEALHRRVISYAEGVIRGEAAPARVAASLLRDIVALRPEIASLTTESSSGGARSAGARSAMVDLVSKLFQARALAALPIAVPSPRPRDQDEGLSGLVAICRSWLQSKLAGNEADIRNSLDALREGTHPLRQRRAPLYRSRRIAVESGIRAAISFTLIAIFFVMAGWPTTEVCLSLVAVIIGLGSTAPDPRMFTAMAVLATPIACVLAGILKYFVFNGVSEFPLLAIGLAPVVIGLALLIAHPNRMLSSLGRLTLVFTMAILAPTNPQNYDPQLFVTITLFSCLSSILTFAVQLLVPPLSNDRRLRLLLADVRRDLGARNTRRHQRLLPEAATFRDATRIEQILTASGVSPSNDHIIDEMMRCFDQAAALRQCHAELDRLMPGPLADTADAARAVLARRDGAEMLAAAAGMREAALQHDVSADPACAALVLASVALATAQPAPRSAERKLP